MNNFINYIIESGLSLGVLSLVYFLFLRKETFFKGNRYFLLFSILFSSILPLLHIPILSGITTSSNISNKGIGSVMLESVTVVASDISSSLIALITASNIVLIVYLMGVLISLVLFAIRINQIVRMLKRNEIHKKDGINFVYLKSNDGPYSFLNYLFVCKNCVQSRDWDKMLAHESEHIYQGHTVDLLLLELISIFQWFNPFFWLMKRLIKENHEFMADRAVLDKGLSVVNYKQVLVNQFVGEQLALTNNFNSSLIKSRLKMMTKIKSSNRAKLRFLSGIISIIALVLVFACENKDAEVISNNSLNPLEKRGIYAGNIDNVMLYIIDGEISSKEAFENIDPNSIREVYVSKRADSKYVEKYGDLAKNGVIEMTLIEGAEDAKITKSLEGVVAVGYGDQKAKTYDDVFYKVDEMPEFPGGQSELRKTIAKLIKYPVSAKEEGKKGTVYVSFVVEKDGSVGRVRIARSVDWRLDAEAIRVVSTLPKWKPGKQNGEAVAVSYTVPIAFVLQ